MRSNKQRGVAAAVVSEDAVPHLAPQRRRGRAAAEQAVVDVQESAAGLEAQGEEMFGTSGATATRRRRRTGGGRRRRTAATPGGSAWPTRRGRGRASPAGRGSTGRRRPGRRSGGRSSSDAALPAARRDRTSATSDSALSRSASEVRLDAVEVDGAAPHRLTRGVKRPPKRPPLGLDPRGQERVAVDQTRGTPGTSPARPSVSSAMHARYGRRPFLCTSGDTARVRRIGVRRVWRQVCAESGGRARPSPSACGVVRSLSPTLTQDSPMLKQIARPALAAAAVARGVGCSLQRPERPARTAGARS